MKFTYDNDTPKIHPKCGEIWMCDLPEREGHIQNGYRPVFIISNNLNNMHSSILNVIPITSKQKAHHLPTHVRFRVKENNSFVHGILLVEQITTISAESLRERICHVTDYGILEGIRKAIRTQFPII